MPTKRKRLKRTGQKITASGRFGTKYKPEYATLAAIMGRAGMTEREIADHFKATDRTIRNWKTSYPEFAKALLMGKEVADARVEASLYEMALGYYRDAEEIKVIENKVVRIKVRKFFPASEVAALAWLNNRQRDRWQRHPEPELEPPTVEAPVDPDITPANARQIARKFALVLFKGGKVA